MPFSETTELSVALSHGASELQARVALLPEADRSRWILVGVPAWNEAPALSAWIDRLPLHVGQFVLVPVLIDDGSTDATAQVARAHGWCVITKPQNQGLAHSIQCLFELARKVGARALITMDGDGQHDPAELPRLLEAWSGDARALITGSRYLGATVGQSSLRTQGLKGVSWILALLIGRRILDPACGYRLYAQETLPWMKVSHRRHYAAETLIRGVLAGLRVVEVPITIRQRTAGSSKQGMTLVYGARFTWVLIKSWLLARKDIART